MWSKRARAGLDPFWDYLENLIETLTVPTRIIMPSKKSFSIEHRRGCSTSHRKTVRFSDVARAAVELSEQLVLHLTNNCGPRNENQNCLRIDISSALVGVKINLKSQNSVSDGQVRNKSSLPADASSLDINHSEIASIHVHVQNACNVESVKDQAQSNQAVIIRESSSISRTIEQEKLEHRIILF